MIDAVVEAVGAKNVAVRFSPWSEFQDMKGSYTKCQSEIRVYIQVYL